MKGTPRKLTMLHAKGSDYNRNVPSVLLSGLWLKDCGFAPGDRVTVEKMEDAVYDTRALTSKGNYIELTLTLSNKSAYVQATVGNPAVSGTALPIEDYLSELKIYGAGDTVIFEQGADTTETETVVTTDGSTIYKVRVDKSLLKTQTDGVYYIPIDYKVKTGNAKFNNSGLMYSNYKVSLTAAMYPAINSPANNYSKASYAYDHIIYTNARVVPEVIEP